jgi:chromosome segregation ATPase
MQLKEAGEKLKAAEVQHMAGLLETEQQTTASLRHQKAELQAAARGAESSAQALKAELATCSAHCEQLVRDCAQRESENADLTAHSAQLACQLKELRAEKHELLQHQAQAHAMAAAIMADMEVLRDVACSVHASKQVAALQLQRMQTAAVEQSATLAQLEESLDASETERQMAQEELRQSKVLVGCLQKDVLSLRAKSALLQSSLSAEKSRAEAAASSMQASLQATLSELESCSILLRDKQVLCLAKHLSEDHKF